MNFEELSFDELDQHAMGHLIFDDTEISPILKGHIFIEKVLETLISRKLENPSRLFKQRRSFDLKADMAIAMGLIDEKHYSGFKAINNIRNGYAHKPDYKVTVEELYNLKFDWVDMQAKAFEVSCTRGIEEAARVATAFLCWKAILLIKEPDV